MEHKRHVVEKGSASAAVGLQKGRAAAAVGLQPPVGELARELTVAHRGGVHVGDLDGAHRRRVAAEGGAERRRV